MIDTSRKALSGHSQISQTTIHDWPAILLSIPFIGMGGFVVLISFDVIKTADSQFNASRHLVAAFGGLFVLAGVWVLIHGILSLIERKNVERLKAERPNEAWYGDYKWDSRGIKGDHLNKVKSMLHGLLGITIFLIPFNWFAFIEAKLKVFQIGIGFFDFIMLIFWGYLVYCFLALLKYGVSFLEFHQFPFYLGEELNVTLKTQKPIHGLKQMQLILRFVEEKYEVRGSGKNRESVIVSYQVYAETKMLDNLTGFDQEFVSLPINFMIPQNKEYDSQLSSRPPKYWELEVKAQTPGINYKSCFLLPVYLKP